MDASVPSGGAPLKAQQLPALIDAALLRWLDAGVGEAELHALRRAQWRIDDLPGDLLGLALGDTITLDRDAAGYGWFIDHTPEQDAEFENLLNHDEWSGSAINETAGRMDLLTALMHELGHLLGLDGQDGDPAVTDSLMSSTLVAGHRRRPTQTKRA